MQVFVYKDGQPTEMPFELPINAQVSGKAADVTYIQGAGTFWMKCNCANVRWTMVVEQES